MQRAGWHGSCLDAKSRGDDDAQDDATDGTVIETTLWELTNTIREVSSSDDEAFAVLPADRPVEVR